MQDTTIVSPKEFRKNSDGSWTCIKNTDLKNAYGVYRINPGMTFVKKKPHWGIDVAELLDQADIK